MVYLKIGTRVKYKGKHGVVAKLDRDNPCKACILYREGHCDGGFACAPFEREDEENVYVKELKDEKD